MPRDLFGDVQHPAAPVSSRSRYTVPLSLAAHALAVIAVVGATILGPVVLPGLASANLSYTAIVLPPAPPLPAPPVARHERPAAVPNPDAAPTEAPSGFTAEPDVPIDPGPGTGADTVVGVTSIDAIAGEPPAPPPVEQKPVRAGREIRFPAKVHDASPVYPAIAQAARVEGTVILEATIDADGRVRSARVLRSIPPLDEAALAAVRQWQYTPTLLNGTPVPVVMTVTVTFQLR